MKRLIFFVVFLTTILANKHASAQIPDIITPAYEKSFQTKSLASFNGDTLAYIKHNWAYSCAGRYRYKQPGLGLFFREFEAKITAIEFLVSHNNKIRLIRIHYMKPYEAIKDLEYEDNRLTEHSILVSFEEEMYIDCNELMLRIPELRFAKSIGDGYADLILPWKEEYRAILSKYNVEYILCQDM